MMDRKFYIYEYNECPYCNGNLRDTGKSLTGNQIVQCIECNRIMLESDIVTLQLHNRKDKDEDIKIRQSDY